MADDDEKPRWSFTWLLRLQRTGRPRPELGAGEKATRRHIIQGIIVVVLGALLLVEVAIGLWLDVLPR